MNSLSFKWLIRFVILLVVLLCCYVFMLLAPFWQPVVATTARVLLPFLIAGFITYLLHPVVEQLKHVGIARPVSILLLYFAFLVGLVYLLMKGTPYLIDELKDLFDNIPNFIQTYRQLVSNFYKQTSMLPNGFRVKAEGLLTTIEEVAAEGIVGTVEYLSALVDYFFMLIIIPFLVFYLLKDFQLIEKTAWYLTPRKWRNSCIDMVKNINVSLGNYIRGQLFVCLVVAIIAVLGLWIIGMPYAVILGIFIGITNIIPYFGPILGAVPVAAIAITESFQLVLLGLLINFSIQLVEGNILSPLIVGRSLHMHPLLIMLALIIGGEVGGILGLIIAVPILAIVKVVIMHIRTTFQASSQ